MSIVPAANDRLLGFFRSRWADFIYATRSDDGGITWSKPVATVLPNNNSSIQALRLADGRLAMIFNASSAADATERRESLYDELEDGAVPAARHRGRDVASARAACVLGCAARADDAGAVRGRRARPGRGSAISRSATAGA